MAEVTQHVVRDHDPQASARAPSLSPPTEKSLAVRVASFEYQYDLNGNVSAIIDQQRGTGYNRYMGYDGLDRLMEAGSERFGGDNWNRYTYDVLDNILTAKLPGVRTSRAA